MQKTNTKILLQKFVPKYYDLYIHITPGTYPFNTRVTISFQKNQDDDKVILDNNQNISIAKITQDKTKLKYTIDYPKLVIFRSTSQDISSFPITIDYFTNA